MKSAVAFSTLLALALILSTRLGADPFPPDEEEESNKTMELGAFSISLAVKDLATSRAFYEKLGFTTAGGDAKHGYLIMRNGTSNIGLFQGMFEGNIITFNPGWSNLAEPIEEFDDVRAIQASLEGDGVEIQTRADPESKGPASFVVRDPDGNTILVDQHVARPD